VTPTVPLILPLVLLSIIGVIPGKFFCDKQPKKSVLEKKRPQWVENNNNTAVEGGLMDLEGVVEAA
jgi:hypothetical protein